MTNPIPLIALILSLTLGACIGCPAVAPTQSGIIVEAKVSGEIRLDQSQEPPRIAGALVQLFDDDVLLDEMVTDENGYYSVGFGDACADRGMLEVRIQAPGHEQLIVEFDSRGFDLGLAQE